MSGQTYPCWLCGSFVLFPAPDSSADVLCELCRPVAERKAAAAGRRRCMSYDAPLVDGSNFARSRFDGRTMVITARTRGRR